MSSKKLITNLLDEESIFSILKTDHTQMLNVNQQSCIVNKQLAENTNRHSVAKIDPFFETQFTERSWSLHGFKEIAAIKIQRFWRKYNNISIFRNIKLTLNEFNKNSALALKTINPIEFRLLDTASGTFVRFRLSGEEFPPYIVYKIFTYRPVTEINNVTINDIKLNSNKSTELMEADFKLKRIYSGWRKIKNVPSSAKKKNNINESNRIKNTKIKRANREIKWLKDYLQNKTI